MKCPFRTITTVEQFNTKIGSVTRVEFADCIEKECPFYGKEAIKFNECTMRREKVFISTCRRADNEK